MRHPVKSPAVRRSVAALGSLLTAVALSACSGGNDDPPSNVDPVELLDKAQQTLVDAGSVKIDLTSADVPKGKSGVTAAKGDGVIDADEPKFKGEITGTIQGVTGTIDVVAIGDQVWIKLFTPSFELVDPADLGAPNPAMIFHPETGLAGLLPQTVKPELDETVRDGSDVLTTVDGTIPAKAVYDILKIGEQSGDYDITYGITEGGELRTVEIEGEFYGSEDSTYTLRLTDYGTEVDITEPK